MIQAFFKVIEGQLYIAPNEVKSSSYTLAIADHSSYTYPIEGWYYFTSKEEAIVFFGDLIYELEDPEELLDSPD